MPTALLVQLPDWLERGLTDRLSAGGFTVVSDRTHPLDLSRADAQQDWVMQQEHVGVLVNHADLQLNNPITRQALQFPPTQLYRSALLQMRAIGWGRVVSTYGSGRLTQPLLTQLHDDLSEDFRGANILVNGLNVNEDGLAEAQRPAAREQRIGSAHWLSTVEGQRPHRQFFLGFEASV